ncbi:MAG: nucleotidyl transferase AbiEii/AbiGii toxin family protein [Kiritimatiellae bacterium]|nr:nucleotidyl transferase AbiEii/AbiGii toxin family protein [Kiritimatiellia bacterium]
MCQESVTPQEQNEVLRNAVRLLAARCPRLVARCYWAGTSAISLEELSHRQSFDLDFHTTRALQDVRPILAEVRKRFPDAIETIQAPDEFGSGFRGILTLPDGAQVTLEILSNYEDVPETDLVPSSVAPSVRRVSLPRYLADKIQCVAERAEARDLADIAAVLAARPDLEQTAREFTAAQDALLLAERLLAWTDEAIAEDLAAYDDVQTADAAKARDLLLKWLKADRGEGGAP